MRGEQRRDRLVQPGDMLGQIDQRDGQVAAAVQDAEGQGGDQHEVADLGLTVLPQKDAPGDHAGGQQRCQHGMDQPDMLKIIETAAARGHFGFHAIADPLLFAEGCAECADDAEIADHVDQFAVDRGGLGGIVAMTLRALSGHLEDHRTEYQGDAHERSGQCEIDRPDEADRRACTPKLGGRTFHAPVFSRM